MKKENKFWILAIIFTIIYLLIGQFIMSNMFLTIPYTLFWATDIIYLGFMSASATIGIIGVMKTYKAQQKIKWWLLLFSIFNMCVFITNLIITISPN